MRYCNAIPGKHSDERGATIMEYVVALALIALLFFTAQGVLLLGAESRAEQSADVVGSMVPCGGNLSEEMCY